MTTRQQQALLKRVNRAIENALATVKTDEGRNRLEELTVHVCGYAEPGYDKKQPVIVTGNWNTITRYDAEKNESEDVDCAPKDLGLALEKLKGVALEWCDEWVACDACNGLVCVQPDSYSWKRSYIDDENGDYTCLNCIDPVAHLEALEGQGRSCNTIDSIDPSEHGYVKIEHRFEHGLHEGQADDPKTIARTLRGLGIKRFVFNLDGAAQFDIEFSVHVHQDEIGPEQIGDASVTLQRSLRTVADIEHALSQRENVVPPGPSPAEAMKAALQGVP